jgi:hypothetical protein
VLLWVAGPPALGTHRYYLHLEGMFGRKTDVLLQAGWDTFYLAKSWKFTWDPFSSFLYEGKVTCPKDLPITC